MPSPRLRHNIAVIAGKNPDLAKQLNSAQGYDDPSIPQDRMLWRRCLQPAANNYGSVLVVIGWGNGDLLNWIAADPLLRRKKIVIFVLPGELAQIASSLERLPPIDRILGTVDWGLEYVENEASIFRSLNRYFAHHYDIARLGGCDLLTTHPLSNQIESERAIWAPVIEQLLADRPQALGNSIEDTFTGLLHCIHNARSLLEGPIPDDFAGFYGNTPVISIGGGPSLSRHLDELRALQDRCILICGDSTLKGLLEQGIAPHFTTPLERLPATIDMVSCATESKTVFAGSPVVPPGAVTPFADRVLCPLGFDLVYEWLAPDRQIQLMTGSSTGVFSVSVGSCLTTGPVFLVGHDLCLGEGASHWQGSAASARLWQDSRQAAETGTNSDSGYAGRLIPGNNGSLVQSIGWWDRFRSEISHLAFNLNSNQQRCVFNVAAADGMGAVIENTRPSPLPKSSQLPTLASFCLPPGKPQRFPAFQQRARVLMDDCLALERHMKNALTNASNMLTENPLQWDLSELSRQVNITSGVSEGNHLAFMYVLRSALHNTAMATERQLHVTSSPAKANRIIFDGYIGLAEAVSNALESLAPRLQGAINDL